MSNDSSFDSMISSGSATIEEGTIIGRSYMKTGVTPTLQGAEVNGPVGDKAQWLWDGTYSVALDRGSIGLTGVYHITGTGGGSAQNQRCLAIQERVTIMWLTRDGVQIPVILENCTIDFYKKNLESNGHLLDMGEQIVRSGIATAPGGSEDSPFANNQYEQGVNTPDQSSQDFSKRVRFPGGETFYDKFGRIISLSRTADYETLVTHGKIDSGQDDVTDQDTVTKQDTYYDKILTDESEPVNVEEPFAPKAINLSQYIQKRKNFKVVGDKDPNRTVSRGLLPRFDKWKFIPIVIRKYKADSPGEPTDNETFSTRQVRQQSVITSTTKSYGYVHTLTQQGDVKEFVPRHINQRIVGDKLVSQGGNNEFRLQTTSNLFDGTDNPVSFIHREYLENGTRLRIAEDLDAGTSTYDKKVLLDGTTELYIKEGGGTSTDFNLKIKLSPSGAIEIESKDDTNITLTGKFTLDSSSTEIKGDTTLSGGSLTVGGTAVPNGQGGFCGLSHCLFTGAPQTSNKIVGT